MILVTGAAGKTGKAVVEALAKKGARVRAMVRSSEHFTALKAVGARFNTGLRPVCEVICSTTAEGAARKLSALLMTAYHPTDGPQPNFHAEPIYWRK